MRSWCTGRDISRDVSSDLACRNNGPIPFVRSRTPSYWEIYLNVQFEFYFLHRICNIQEHHYPAMDSTTMEGCKCSLYEHSKENTWFVWLSWNLNGTIASSLAVKEWTPIWEHSTLLFSFNSTFRIQYRILFNWKWTEC